MSEQAAYNTLRKNMPLPTDRLDRVENLVLAGMPDTNFCADGMECWIELKAPKEPKRSTTPLFGTGHKLTLDQRNWLTRQRMAGGASFVLIATDKRWMLVDGRHADFINDMSVDDLLRQSLWHTTKPVRKERWKELRCALLASSRPSHTSTSSIA